MTVVYWKTHLHEPPTKDSFLSQIQPPDLLWRQFDIQPVEAGSRLAQLSRADQGEGGEGLVQHVRQRDVDRQNIAFAGELVHAPEALEIVLGVPASDQLFVLAFLGMRAAF